MSLIQYLATISAASIEAQCRPIREDLRVEPFDKLLAYALILSALEAAVAEEAEKAEKAEKERDAAIRDLCKWRSAIQELTPGGSEYMSVEAVREFAQDQKRRTFEAAKRAVMAEKALRDKTAAAKGLAEALKNLVLDLEQRADMAAKAGVEDEAIVACGSGVYARAEEALKLFNEASNA